MQERSEKSATSCFILLPWPTYACLICSLLSNKNAKRSIEAQSWIVDWYETLHTGNIWKYCITLHKFVVHWVIEYLWYFNIHTLRIIKFQRGHAEQIYITYSYVQSFHFTKFDYMNFEFSGNFVWVADFNRQHLHTEPPHYLTMMLLCSDVLDVTVFFIRMIVIW